MSDGRTVAGGHGGGSGPVLALDFGDRRIGVAVSDRLGVAARPVMTLTRSSWDRDLESIDRMAREHGARRIVVGLPLDMNGTRGRRARVTESFMARVRRATGLPVIPWDERLTTVQAERALLEGDVSRARRRQVIDQVAAVIILQAYLDAQRVTGAG
ncbi:MAG: Holliday junction resolvase RuvX [Acidobacteriota bacterium]